MSDHVSFCTSSPDGDLPASIKSNGRVRFFPGEERASKCFRGKGIEGGIDLCKSRPKKKKRHETCRATYNLSHNTARLAPRFSNRKISENLPPCYLLPLQNNRKRHEPKHGGLEPGVFAQENGNVAHERHVSQHAPNNILLAVEEALAARVKLGVVCGVVVALGQELQRCASVEFDCNQ